MTPEGTDLTTYVQETGSVIKYQPEDVSEILKSPFLPRFQVCGSQSDAAKQGLVQLGHWGLVYDKNRVRDLGKEIDIGVFNLRPKALKLPKDGSNPLSYYDKNSPEFVAVAKESAIQDSGCMYGLEFLVWIPTTSEFASLYLGTQSARREAPSLLNLMQMDADGNPREGYGPCLATCRTQLVTNARRQSWHVPKFFRNSSNLATLPDTEELKEESEKFNNPPKSVVEEIPQQPGTDARPR
jgi:hypothetical protein